MIFVVIVVITIIIIIMISIIIIVIHIFSIIRRFLYSIWFMLIYFDLILVMC